MKGLAVSNIAWKRHDAPAIMQLLKKYGVTGIEVAPSKVWPDWVGSGFQSACEYRKKLADNGFCVPAMQALLFGKKHFRVFDKNTHPEFLAHIKLVAEIAEGLGARVLVFGSPGNRRRGGLGFQEAIDTAAEFFRQAGEICAGHGAVLGIEPNPAEYCCDFVNNIDDARRLVAAADCRGVKLHVDRGAMLMNGETMMQICRNGVPDWVHYHISEPGLANAGNSSGDLPGDIKFLRSAGYSEWLSIEMRGEEPEYEMLERALCTVREAIDAAGF